MTLALATIFVLHALIFTIQGFRRGEPRNFVLAGTFVLLTILYGMRYAGFQQEVGGPVHWDLVLRVGAFCCTATYLILTGRQKGTWVHRFVTRLAR